MAGSSRSRRPRSSASAEARQPRRAGRVRSPTSARRSPGPASTTIAQAAPASARSRRNPANASGEPWNPERVDPLLLPPVGERFRLGVVLAHHDDAGPGRQGGALPARAGGLVPQDGGLGPEVLRRRPPPVPPVRPAPRQPHDGLGLPAHPHGRRRLRRGQQRAFHCGDASPPGTGVPRTGRGAPSPTPPGAPGGRPARGSGTRTPRARPGRWGRRCRPRSRCARRPPPRRAWPRAWRPCRGGAGPARHQASDRDPRGDAPPPRPAS